MQVQELLRYSDHTMKELQSTIEKHPDVFNQEFETLSNFKSIRQLVAHMAGAEERWVIQRLLESPPGTRFEDRAPEGMVDLFDEWERIRAHTRAFVAALDVAGLTGMIPVSLPHHGYEGKKTVEQILFQVFNHQTYHLGQISMTLQRLGIDPPNFDYILMPDDSH